eukprot:11216349-Lingulodinium_polyedra.AAC.1
MWQGWRLSYRNEEPETISDVKIPKRLKTKFESQADARDQLPKAERRKNMNDAFGRFQRGQEKKKAKQKTVNNYL